VKYFELDTQSQFKEKNLCLAIGNFDGFHKGHVAILNSLKKIANKKNQTTAIMSFNPHPREFFESTIENFNIYTKSDKIRFLKKYKPWGIILFTRNIKNIRQTQKLTYNIRKIFKDRSYPILIDQEGGRVNRLKNIITFDNLTSEFFGKKYLTNNYEFKIFYSFIISYSKF